MLLLAVSSQTIRKLKSPKDYDEAVYLYLRGKPNANLSYAWVPCREGIQTEFDIDIDAKLGVVFYPHLFIVKKSHTKPSFQQISGAIYDAAEENT